MVSADAYELRYGQKRLRDVDRLRIGRDVDNGGLLTACAFNDQVKAFLPHDAQARVLRRAS